MSTAEEQTGFTVYLTQYSKDGGKINTIYQKKEILYILWRLDYQTSKLQLSDTPLNWTQIAHDMECME